MTDISRRLQYLQGQTPQATMQQVDVPAWERRYEAVHNHAPGRGNGETDVEARANLLWSLDFQSHFGRGPEQKEWEAHHAAYTSGQDERWEEYLRRAAAGEGAPTSAPPAVGTYPADPKQRDPLPATRIDNGDPTGWLTPATSGTGYNEAGYTAPHRGRSIAGESVPPWLREQTLATPPSAGAVRAAATKPTTTATGQYVAYDRTGASSAATPYQPMFAEYADAIRAAAEQTGVPSELIEAVIKFESGGRADAVSHAGAIGVMQLMPATARGLGVDPTDPAQNIMGGARYLADMYRQYGDWEKALTAYNFGPGNVNRGRQAPPETIRYVNDIMETWGGVQSAPTTPSASAPAATGDWTTALDPLRGNHRGNRAEQWQFGERPQDYTAFGRTGGDIGWDLTAKVGDPVGAAIPGEVVFVGEHPDGWGNFVQVMDVLGNVHNYAHLNDVSVAVGDRITDPTQTLGTVGMTGNTTGPHLDYTVFAPGTPRTSDGYYYGYNDPVHGGAVDPRTIIGQPFAQPQTQPAQQVEEDGLAWMQNSRSNRTAPTTPQRPAQRPEDVADNRAPAPAPSAATSQYNNAYGQREVLPLFVRPTADDPNTRSGGSFGGSRQETAPPWERGVQNALDTITQPMRDRLEEGQAQLRGYQSIFGGQPLSDEDRALLERTQNRNQQRNLMGPFGGIIDYGELTQGLSDVGSTLGASAIEQARYGDVTGDEVANRLSIEGGVQSIPSFIFARIRGNPTLAREFQARVAAGEDPRAVAAELSNPAVEFIGDALVPDPLDIVGGAASGVTAMRGLRNVGNVDAIRGMRLTNDVEPPFLGIRDEGVQEALAGFRNRNQPPPWYRFAEEQAEEAAPFEPYTGRFRTTNETTPTAASVEPLTADEIRAAERAYGEVKGFTGVMPYRKAWVAKHHPELVETITRRDGTTFTRPMNENRWPEEVRREWVNNLYTKIGASPPEPTPPAAAQVAPEMTYSVNADGTVSRAAGSPSFMPRNTVADEAVEIVPSAPAAVDDWEMRGENSRDAAGAAGVGTNEPVAGDEWDEIIAPPRTVEEVATTTPTVSINVPQLLGKGAGLTWRATKARMKLTTAAAAATGAAGTAKFILETPDGEQLAERDAVGNWRGVLPDMLREAILDESNPDSLSTWLRDASGGREGGVWDKVAGIASAALNAVTAGPDAMQPFVGLGAAMLANEALDDAPLVGGLFADPNSFVARQARADLSDRERTAYFHALRNFYSGDEAVEAAYNTLLALPDDATPEQVRDLLNEHKDYTEEGWAQFFIDPTTVINLSTATRAANAAGLVGEANKAVGNITQLRAFQAGLKAYDEVNSALRAGLGAQAGRLATRFMDATHTAQGRAGREARAAWNQLEGKLAAATTGDEVIRAVEELLSTTATDKGAGMNLFGRLNGGRVLRDLTRGMGTMTPDEARRYAQTMIVPMLTDVAKIKYGVRPPTVPQKLMQVRKSALSALMLTSLRFLERNVVNGIVTGWWDGVGMSLTPKGINNFWNKVGIRPGIVDDIQPDEFGATNIMGRVRSLMSVTESFQARQVATHSYQHWFPVFWSRGLSHAVQPFRTLGADDRALARLVGQTGGVWNFDEVLKQVDNWARIEGVDPADAVRIAEQYMQPVFAKAVSAGLSSAEWQRGFTLLNYWDKRKWDGALEVFNPYHFWSTYSRLNWVERIAEKPYLYNGYRNLREALIHDINGDAVEPMHQRDGFSYRGRDHLADNLEAKDNIVADALAAMVRAVPGSMDIFAPRNFGADVTAGERLYLDVLPLVFPFEDLGEFLPGLGYDREIDEDKTWWVNDALKGMEDASFSPSPDIMALVSWADRGLTGGRLLDRNYFDYNTPLSVDPVLRAASIKAEPWLEAQGLDVPPQGITTAPLARAAAGYGWSLPAWEQRGAATRLADWAREGFIPDAEASYAWATREGDLHDQAVRAESVLRSNRGTASFLAAVGPQSTPHQELVNQNEQYKDQLAAMRQQYPDVDGEWAPEVDAWSNDYLNAAPGLRLYRSRYAEQGDNPDTGERGSAYSHLRNFASKYAIDEQLARLMVEQHELLNRELPTTSDRERTAEVQKLLDAINHLQEGRATDAEARMAVVAIRQLQSSLAGETERVEAERSISRVVNQELPDYERVRQGYYAIVREDFPTEDAWREARNKYKETNPTLQRGWDRQAELREQYGDLFEETAAQSHLSQIENPASDGEMEFALSIGLTAEQAEQMDHFEVQDWVDERKRSVARQVGIPFSRIETLEKKENLTDTEKEQLQTFRDALYVEEPETWQGMHDAKPASKPSSENQRQLAINLGLDPDAAAIFTQDQISKWIGDEMDRSARVEEEALRMVGGGYTAEQYKQDSEEYFNIPESNRAARKAFRESHPQMVEMWDAKRAIEGGESGQGRSNNSLNYLSDR